MGQRKSSFVYMNPTQALCSDRIVVCLWSALRKLCATRELMGHCVPGGTMATENPPELPISWVGFDELPIVFANQIMIQSTGPREIVLIFGQVANPPTAGTQEEQLAQLGEIPFVPIRPLARLGMTLDRLREFLAAMQAQVETPRGILAEDGPTTGGAMTPMLTANDSTAPTITPEDSGANSERWGFPIPFSMPVEQTYYWSLAWQTQEAGAPTDLAAGRFLEFSGDDPEDIARWLQEPEE